MNTDQAPKFFRRYLNQHGREIARSFGWSVETMEQALKATWHESTCINRSVRLYVEGMPVVTYSNGNIVETFA